MKFEEKLVILRKERKLSQEQLAEKLGVSRQAVSRWEAGETTPDMLNILGLCDIFEVSADYLMRESLQTDDLSPPAVGTSEALAASRRNNLFRLISACSFQVATICSVITLCHSNTPLQYLLSTLCLAVFCGLTTYQLVSYGKGCAHAAQQSK